MLKSQLLSFDAITSLNVNIFKKQYNFIQCININIFIQYNILNINL